MDNAECAEYGSIMLEDGWGCCEVVYSNWMDMGIVTYYTCGQTSVIEYPELIVPLRIME